MDGYLYGDARRHIFDSLKALKVKDIEAEESIEDGLIYRISPMGRLDSIS